MIKRIRDVGPRQRRIKDIGLSQPRVDPEVVAEKLGARAVGHTERGGNPMAFFALREQLMAQRISSGGRPGLKGATRRQKIPLTEEQWEELDVLANLLIETGVRTSPGQVASLLLQHALLEVKSVVSESPRPPRAKKK